MFVRNNSMYEMDETSEDLPIGWILQPLLTPTVENSIDLKPIDFAGFEEQNTDNE